jgi:hypothetical protein
MARTHNLNIANYMKQGGNPAALDFPGNNEVFTLAAWIRIAQNDATDMTFFSMYDGTKGPLMRTISGKLRMFWIDSGVGGHEAIGATTMSTNTWYHVAATWPKSTSPGMQVWLNGTVDGSDTTNGTLSGTRDTTNGWCLGVRGNAGSAKSNPLNGVMAEAAMWNTNLTAAEIIALAKGNSPKLVRPTSLKGYWPIHAIATPETDFSGNVDNFTVVGTLALADHSPTGPSVPPGLADPHIGGRR